MAPSNARTVPLAASNRPPVLDPLGDIAHHGHGAVRASAARHRSRRHTAVNTLHLKRHKLGLLPGCSLAPSLQTIHVANSMLSHDAVRIGPSSRSLASLNPLLASTQALVGTLAGLARLLEADEYDRLCAREIGVFVAIDAVGQPRRPPFANCFVSKALTTPVGGGLAPCLATGRRAQPARAAVRDHGAKVSQNGDHVVWALRGGQGGVGAAVGARLWCGRRFPSWLRQIFRRSVELSQRCGRRQRAGSSSRAGRGSDLRARQGQGGRNPSGVLPGHDHAQQNGKGQGQPDPTLSSHSDSETIGRFGPLASSCPAHAPVDSVASRFVDSSALPHPLAPPATRHRASLAFNGSQRPNSCAS